MENQFYSHALGKTLVFTKHVCVRMNERNIGYPEIIEVLKNGRQQPGTNQRCYRKLVVAFEHVGDEVHILTTWDQKQAA